MLDLINMLKADLVHSYFLFKNTNIIWSEIIPHQVGADGISGPFLKHSRGKVNSWMSKCVCTLGVQVVCIKKFEGDNADLLKRGWDSPDRD